jgi:soluble lytic murein transglycosylase
MKNNFLRLTILICFLLTSCTYSMTTPAGGNPSLEIAIPFTLTPTATPSPKARVAIAEDAMLNGDYETALSQFQAALTTSDAEVVAEARLGMGKIYFMEEQYNNAIQQLGWLINTTSDNEFRTQAFFFIARSYEGINAYALAAESYDNYLKLVPDTPLLGDILEMEGDALVAAGDNAKAMIVYQQAQTIARPEYSEGIKLKTAQATAAAGENETALSLYQALYDQTTNTNTLSTINLMMGRIYLAQGNPEKAYARFQDSMEYGNVQSYDTYSQLVALVDAEQTVGDLRRGEIDYYMGQYGVAVNAFDRFMAFDPQHTDEVHYYKALSLYKMGNYEGEIAEWDDLIQNHPNGTHYAQAFLEKATTQKYHLNSYISSAQTLLKFVEISPTAIEAADYIFQAARTFEENNLLEEAAKTWERVIVEYPGNENAILAQFEAGICYYRLGQYQKAQITFQKNSLQSISPADIARAQLWAGKSLEMQYKHDEALAHFQQAVDSDPTGYYSIRAQELLNGQNPFSTGEIIDLGINWDKERKDADYWMRERFNIPAEVDLTSPGDLAQNVLYQRGNAFLELGMSAKAQSEFESLRSELTADALNSYRLMNHMLDLGLYQTAILSARQVLDLTGLNQTKFLDEAPKYFNHIRFGVYYRDTIVSAANEKEIDPLLLFSVIRQESFFEADIVSSAAAVGLMQITPATGAEIAGEYSWPENYSTPDLTRPLVNVKLGTYYLTKWYKYFDNDMMAALAAYNGGPLATIGWKDLAGEDPDLLLEVIRPSETRDYIRYIREFFEIYRTIYTARSE